jgi:nucleoside-diphosphate-sugar epimerase
MKRVLVTGGRGFIGSHLVEELGRRGHEVWACHLMCYHINKYRQVARLSNEHGFYCANQVIAVRE